MVLPGYGTDFRRLITLRSLLFGEDEGFLLLIQSLFPENCT